MSDPQHIVIHPYDTARFPDRSERAAATAAVDAAIGPAPADDPPPRGPEAQAAAPAPAKRRRIDWSRAAVLLARGNSIEEAASSLGCPPQAIRRNLRRSRKFRLRIESEHRHCRLAAQMRFGMLGDYAIGHMKLHPDNPRLLQWLGDRLGLGDLSGQGGGLARRLQAALQPGQRIQTDQEAEEHLIGKRELETMLREAREWHEAKEAHDRMKFEKRELEKQQRAEAEGRETAEFDAS